MSYIQFMDFPAEMLLIILTYLDVKSLINCGKVSKKIRNISNDESFWRQVNLQSTSEGNSHTFYGQNSNEKFDFMYITMVNKYLLESLQV